MTYAAVKCCQTPTDGVTATDTVSQVEHDLDGFGLSGAGGGVETIGNPTLVEAKAVRDHWEHIDTLVLQQAQTQRVLQHHTAFPLRYTTEDKAWCDRQQPQRPQTVLQYVKSQALQPDFGIIQAH